VSDWPRRLALAMEWLWLLGGTACLAAAAAAAMSETFFARAERAWAEARRSPRGRRLAPLAVGVLPTALLATFKLGQFRAHELMWDSGVTANLAWNMLHGYGIHSSVIGDASYLAVHFAFAVVWVSPLLLLWNSAGVLALAQGAAVGSTVLGVWLVARRVLDDSLFAALVALLAASSWFFHDLTFCVLDNSVYAFPLFVWALCAWLSGRRGAAFALFALLATTREQIPFLFFGLGAYAWTLAKTRAERRAAAALLVFAPLLFLGELALIRRAQSQWMDVGGYWSIFASLGGSPAAVTRTALLRPWRFAAALIRPASKLGTIARVLLMFAFLPPLAGAGFLPALAVWLPNQLSDPGAFHALNSHTCAYLFGPLAWASALGARRLLERRILARRTLAALILAAAGLGFVGAARFRSPERMNPASWTDAGPRALARIPPGASVWCDEFFLPNLATRRWVKSLPRVDEPWFRAGLFVPDRVLISAAWTQVASPDIVAPALAALRERGFAPVFAEGDLVVLANPATLGREGAAPAPLSLPRAAR